MDNKQIVTDILDASIKAYNSPLDPGQHLKNSDEVVIHGSGSSLDSLEFVNFVVIVESEFEARVGKTIFIVDEHAMGGSDNPFRTLGSLKNLLLTKL